jgi:hypothetical protein
MFFTHVTARAALVALAVSLVTAGCSIREDAAEAEQARPLTSYESDGAAAGDWLEATSRLVARQLAKSDDGVAMLPATMGPDLVRASSASLVLGPRDHPLIQADVDRAFRAGSGLYRVHGYPDLYATYLVTRADPGSGRDVVDGVRARMRRLSERVSRSDRGAASEVRYGIATLHGLGAPAPGLRVDTCPGLANAVEKADVLAMASFLALTDELPTCAVAQREQMIDIADAEAGRTTGDMFLFPVVHSAATVLDALEAPAPELPACSRLLSLADDDGYAPLVASTDVRLCNDALTMHGHPAEPSEDVTAVLVTEWATGARLPYAATTNARGAAYLLAALEALDFRPDVVEAVRATPVGEDDPTTDRIALDLATGEATEESWSVVDLDRAWPADALVTLAQLVSATDTCPSPVSDDFGAVLPGLEVVSARSAHEAALVLAARTVCGMADTRESSTLRRAVEKEVEALRATPLDVIDRWRLAETSCVMTGKLPFGPETILENLPDHSAARAAIGTYDELYAGVRLAGMAQSGCWDES